MQRFKEKYLEACKSNDIQPLEYVKDMLSIPSGPSANAVHLAQAQSEQDTTEKLSSNKYNRELNLSNQTISQKVILKCACDIMCTVDV